MPPYDSDLFDPPAPLARVTLRAVPSRKTVTNVPMLIDTGSDITLISEAAIADFGQDIRLDKSVKLESFDGHISEAKSVEIDLIFLGLTFRGNVPLINSPVGVLGRNVLNRFPILLDGPRLNWERIRESQD
jgi:hypothetical protein